MLIACAKDDKTKGGQLRDLGAEVIVMPDLSHAPPAKVDLPALMQELGRRGINELHVEAGCKLNGSLISEGCVDELLVYLAPFLLGERARGMADLPELTDLSARRALSINEVQAVGTDIRLMARSGTS